MHSTDVHPAAAENATDRVEDSLRAKLLHRAKEFARLKQCGLSAVGRQCRGDSTFFKRISDPSKSFTARTFDEVMQWFDENWPATDAPVDEQAA